jgi:predicted enzyme related to lactoylglutathione lyase
VEFLEYELPAVGRPMPQDSAVTDLWHWHVTVKVRDVDAATASLCSQAMCVSQASVALPDRMMGLTKSLLVRDPDGHAIQLVSQ